MSSISLSFLQSTFSYSNLHHQHKLFIQPPSSSQWRRTSMIVGAGARTRQENRKARHVRIRKKVEGTPERPRMCVFRSNKHLYVQVIDDTKMHTLASASTMQKPLSEGFDYTSGPTIVSSSFNTKQLYTHVTKRIADA